MGVSLAEYRLGGLRWIVLNGPDREAFGALGEHVREERPRRRSLAGAARAAPSCLRPARPRSAARAAPSCLRPARPRLLAAVRRVTAESFPAEWAELAAFAAGAGVPFDDLALLNLRGDLAWSTAVSGAATWDGGGTRSVVAHNEDGALRRRRPVRAAHA